MIIKVIIIYIYNYQSHYYLLEYMITYDNTYYINDISDFINK